MLTSSLAPVVDPDHPWLGLSSFTYETRDYFFGRGAEIKEIFQRVKEHPLTVLYGQAGYGKTSLLRAGLMAELKDAGFNPIVIRLDFGESGPPLIEHTLNALTLLWTWGDIPGLYDDPNKTQPRLVNRRVLWELLHLNSNALGYAQLKPVIIFDQFEEIFTLGDDTSNEANATRGRELAEEVAEFFEQLADVIENRPPAKLEERFRADRALIRQYDLAASPLRVVLTLREDYLSHLEAWKKMLPSLMRNRMALKLLSGPQALESVVKPGRIDGRNLVSDEVGAQIVRFVAKRKPDTPLDEIEAVPPLLSLLCDELNKARLAHKPEPLPQITAGLVTEQGADILQLFYTRSFADYPPEVRNITENLLLTDDGHRDSVAREKLERGLAIHAISAQVIDALIQSRLLSQEERGGIQRIEFVHDVIAQLAVTSRDQRYEREAKEKAEFETREALKREAKARQERTRLRLLAAALGIMAALSIGGLIFGWVNYTHAQTALKNQSHSDFEAAYASANVLARDDDDKAIVHLLGNYLKREELKDHPRYAEARNVFENSQRHLAINEAARRGFLAELQHIELYIGKEVGLEVIRIPATQTPFVMGSPKGSTGGSVREEFERPHPVTISRPFYMGKYTITQEQYSALIGANPSKFLGPKLPVEDVSFSSANAFCEKLTRNLQGVLPAETIVQLPTEAQWEYACRSGSTTRYYTGDTRSDLDRAGWYEENSMGSTQPVGQKVPNSFGLYDMHGNVFQSCRDYMRDDYDKLPSVDPISEIAGASRKSARVMRGGCWRSDADDCRSARREFNLFSDRGGFVGFRITISLKTAVTP